MTDHAIKTRTLNEILDRFDKEIIPRLGAKTQREYRRNIMTLRAEFGSRIAAQLTPVDLEGFMSVSSGKSQRDNVVRVLSSVLTRAVRDWRWLDYNVCHSIRKYEGKTHSRFVTDEDIDAFSAISIESLRLFLQLALATAQPQEAIVSLKWSQIHPYEILFRDPFGRNKISVAITPAVRKILTECKRRSKSSAYVITTQHGERYTEFGFRALWQRTMRKFETTGNNRFTHYDVRANAQDRIKKAQGPVQSPRNEGTRYPEFAQAVREEAAEMAGQYEIFYCLEQAIRKFVTSHLSEAFGAAWWSSGHVPQDIVADAAAIMRRERDSGITPRSDDPIDYTSFGQLSGIITSNWTLFETKMKNTSKRAVERVMSNLNLIRGPIAHCCKMSHDERDRLGLAVKDWFRMSAA
jgi:integrase